MEKQKLGFNAKAKNEVFRKPWELAIGSCHAYTLLREDVRSHFEKIHKSCGIQSIRCHGLFDDDMQVVFYNDEHKIEYSFFNIDSIYDWMMRVGLKPFVELSFMPEALASDPTKTVFHYKGIVSLPRDMKEWSAFIQAFATHLEERYGKKEVRSWHFEVWNEPNLGGDILNFKTGFFAGSQEQYFELYRVTALALKKVDSKLIVGGPATSNNRWLPEFRDYCQKHAVPLDFLSTHHYPTDVIFGDNPQATAEIKKLDHDMETAKNKKQAMKAFWAFRDNVWRYVDRGTCLTMETKARKEAGNLPLIYTEWQSLAGLHSDGEFGASFNVKTVMDCRDIVDGYSFWCGSDVFEEGPQPSKEFCGGFGLITFHGIPKACFHAFSLLHSLQGRIQKTKAGTGTLDAYYITSPEKDYVLLINHNSLQHPIDSIAGTIRISGFDSNLKAVTQSIIDHTHSNALTVYQEVYHSKPYLSMSEIAELKSHDRLFTRPFKDYSQQDNIVTLPYIIDKQAVVLFTLTKTQA
jgi:xylan 1,4-beta-xylosidase